MCYFIDFRVVALTDRRALPGTYREPLWRDSDITANWIQKFAQLEDESQPSPKPVLYSPSGLLRFVWSSSCAAGLLNHHSVQISSSGRQRSVASFESVDLEYVGNDIGVGPGRQ